MYNLRDEWTDKSKDRGSTVMFFRLMGLASTKESQKTTSGTLTETVFDAVVLGLCCGNSANFNGIKWVKYSISLFM